MLVYFLEGQLPWTTGLNENTEKAFIETSALKLKATIDDICFGKSCIILIN